MAPSSPAPAPAGAPAVASEAVVGTPTATDVATPTPAPTATPVPTARAVAAAAAAASTTISSSSSTAASTEAVASERTAAELTVRTSSTPSPSPAAAVTAPATSTSTAPSVSTPSSVSTPTAAAAAAVAASAAAAAAAAAASSGPVIRNHSEILQNMQCYNCGYWFMMCPCQGLGDGEDMQFVLRESDLPATVPGTLSAGINIHRHLEFWAELNMAHTRGNRIDSVKFVQDILQRGAVQAMTTHRGVMEKVWTEYKADKTQIKEVKKKWKNVWSVPQLKAIGDETLESFFTGRWYELTVFGLTLLIQALNFSDLEPEDQPDLRVMAECVAFITEVVKNISTKPGFTIVAPASYVRIRTMTIFAPLLDFT